MRKQLDYNIQEPQDTDTRTKRLFAWLPVLVGNTWVWLERYYVLEVYKTENVIVAIEQDDKRIPKKFTIGKWLTVSKALID